MLQKIIGYSFGTGVCPNSEDTYHHSSSYVYEKENGYYKCICSICGQTFTAYESDLQQSYEAQVSELPADNINSQGLSNFYITGWAYVPVGLYQTIVSSESDYPCFSAFSTSGPNVSVRCTSGLFSVPISGSYEIVFPASEYFEESALSGRFECTISGGSLSSFNLGRIDSGLSRKIALVAGEEYSIQYKVGIYPESKATADLAFYRCYRPYIAGVHIVSSGDISYNITSRPTSITGNYGIIGDNGQITQVEDNSTIVNETKNTFYNPATGATVPITNWSYDYSDRSYKVTLESGDTVTVTYGDENISIKEGDTVYNIYYLVDGSGSETPPEACAHDWQKGEAKVPTCAIPGSASYVCSKCQQTKTETIPALGHDWQVKQTVTTQYDDTGQLVQAGYTIFECTRCHEQYKSTDGAIPPGGGSGTDPGEDGETIWDKLGKLLGTAVKALLDLLGAAVDTVLGGLIDLILNLVESLKQLVDLFGSVGEAFQVLWTWLPPEVTAILVAGVSIFVFVALLKFFMK